jgi:hypothetical protein
MAEAERAASTGATAAALMLAGTALESAARYLLEMRGVPVVSDSPMGNVVAQARNEIGGELADELLRLWTLRNRVAHSSRIEDLRLPAVDEMLDAFKSVVAALVETARRHATLTGIPCPRCKRLTMGSGGGENVCGNCGYVSDMD